MNITHTIHTCFKSLLRNKMRSILTSLGIIIGTSSVIIMMGIGRGSQTLIESQIAAMGTNLLQIMPQHSYGTNASLNPAVLSMSDLQKIKSEAAYVSGVSGVAQGSFTAQGTKGNGSVTVTGVESEYLFIKNREILSGEFFDDDDAASFRRVAVLGTTTAKNLFGSAEDAVGKSVQVGNGIFTVKGILSPLGTSGGRDQDDALWIPLATFNARLSAAGTLDSIAVSVKSKDLIPLAQKDLQEIMRESHGLSASQADNFSIMNSADVLSVATNTSQTLTVLLSAIAAVSLLVGGIGIMNIMLVSVTERIREIGILMSIGATQGDILSQFLAESVGLSLAGGIIGILISVVSCAALNARGIPAEISFTVVLVAAGFAVAVGVFFGFYPAWKASRLTPIQALRWE